MMEDYYNYDTYQDSMKEGEYSGYGCFHREEYSSDSDSGSESEDSCNLDEDEDDNNANELPSINTYIPELKEAAYVTVAVSLWNHIRISSYAKETINVKSKLYSLFADVKKLVKELPVPKLVAERIDKYVDQVGEEIAKWISFHCREILNKFDRYSLYCEISRLIWYPNGTIDCAQTARNLLKSDFLSEDNKYELMCTYCLKDEIDSLSPLFMYVTRKSEDLSDHPLIFYWTYYRKNKLHMIPKKNGLSIDSFMFRSDRVNNWPAKEYFFNRLNHDEQIQSAIWLIEYGSNAKAFQKLVLKNLNESQRLQVYMDHAVKIMENSINDSEELFSTWLEIQNLITPDQFVSLVHVLFELKYYPNVLTDVWASFSDTFKNHLLNYKDHQLVETVLHSWKGDDTFLYLLLSDANPEIKKSIVNARFFIKCCEELLARRRRASSLDKLLNLCFPDTLECINFKKNLVLNSLSVKNRCLRYYESGNTRSLNDSLMLYLSPDVDLIAEYKRKLLLSVDGVAQCIHYMDSTTDVLHKIITDGLADAEAVAVFKKRLIFSQHSIEILNSRMLNNSLCSVDMCINRYLVSDEDKQALKELIIDDPVKLIRKVFYVRNESWWRNVMMWYFGNEEAIRQFKTTLSLDEIVDEMIKKIIFRNYDDSLRLSYCLFKKVIRFDPLNHFLNWYFETPDKVKEYKLRRIHSYNEIDTVRALLKKKDDVYLRIIMSWFFNKDAEEIKKFKKTFSGKIITMI